MLNQMTTQITMRAGQKDQIMGNDAVKLVLWRYLMLQTHEITLVTRLLRMS